MDIGLSFFDIIKLTYRILIYKYQQRKLTTSVQAVVKTKLGAVKGVKRNTVWGESYYSFEKIPYAKPPIDELRFKAPVAIEPWEHELDCTSPAEKPLQTNMILRKYAGSEDCLYLNVFAKDLQPPSPRPVMVWIYGGGFQVGEASRDMYSPDFFMSKDIVLVSIAYRLGAFGFLSLDDPELDVPGNAGLKDQVMGLQWVKDNIAAFGGDPNNITLFGESAGGASTHWLILSDKTKDLVHKAIMMSGSALCPWTMPPRHDRAYRLAVKLGYTGAPTDKEVYEFLRSAKGSDIVQAVETVLTKEEQVNRLSFAFGPVVEPYVTEHCVVPAHPYELMKNTWSNAIPIMLGGTSFEGLLFYMDFKLHPERFHKDANCTKWLPADLDASLDQKILDNYEKELKRAYFGENSSNNDIKMNFFDMASYREFWHPIYRTALARLRHATAPTYLYRFAFDSNICNSVRLLFCGPGIRGACHGDDLCYTFNSMLTCITAPNTPEDRCRRDMIDIWTSFATHSDPNCAALQSAKFEPLKSDTPMRCLNIADEISYIQLPELEKLQVWNGFYANDKL